MENFVDVMQLKNLMKRIVNHICFLPQKLRQIKRDADVVFGGDSCIYKADGIEGEGWWPKSISAAHS